MLLPLLCPSPLCLEPFTFTLAILLLLLLLLLLLVLLKPPPMDLDFEFLRGKGVDERDETLEASATK
jgi:hypothetical protein